MKESKICYHAIPIRMEYGQWAWDQLHRLWVTRPCSRKSRIAYFLVAIHFDLTKRFWLA